MERTNRIFTDTESKEIFVLYTNSNGNYHLISDGSDKHAKGTEVNGFYICAHCGVTIKINNAKIVKLNQGEFYNFKENELVTHKKYIGFKRFTKTN